MTRVEDKRVYACEEGHEEKIAKTIIDSISGLKAPICATFKVTFRGDGLHTVACLSTEEFQSKNSVRKPTLFDIPGE